MEKLQFTQVISRPANKVFNTMIGPETYKIWAGVFNETSDFEGNWEKDSKIKFFGFSKAGKKEGLIGIIEDHIPNKFVSIRYTGMLDGDKEITEGPQVENWIGLHENYSFSSDDGVTTVTVDLDVDEPFIDYFQETYPKALLKLKETAEAS